MSPLSTHRRANFHKSPSMPYPKSNQRSIFPNVSHYGGQRVPLPTIHWTREKQNEFQIPKNSKSKNVKEAVNLFPECEGPVEEDEESSRLAPQPFPMRTQILTSIVETCSGLGN